MYALQTLFASLGFLMFSRAPFSVLVYAILAQSATTDEQWWTATALCLIAQFAYTLVRSLNDKDR